MPWEKLSMDVPMQGVELKRVRIREHFLGNFLTFLYFRRAEGVSFPMVSGFPGLIVVIPYLAFSEMIFFIKWRTRAKHLFYFIVLKQRVVGVLDLREEIRTLYINNLAVSPDYRRIGIATYALNQAAAIGNKLCKEALELAVHKKNTPALRLYEQHGYSIKEEKRRSFILRKQIIKP
jgi:ribosomal protein S18 acetylase RimI-like enzyme